MPFITQGKTNWKFLLIVIILAVIVGAGALWYSKRPEQSYQPPEIKKTENVVKDETADWKTYKSEEYGFEIKYPQNWTFKEEKNEYSSGSYKKYYRLDIFYPKDIAEAKTYGNVAVVFFGDGDMNEYFEKQLSIMRRDLTRTLENVTIDNMNGVKGITYTESGEAKSMFIDEMLLNSQKQIAYKVWAWAIDLGNNKYQEQTKLIISTLKFLD
jgi:hypothetical protein